MRKILVQDGIDASHIEIAYSGIDPERLRSLPDRSVIRGEFGVPGDEILFGNVAALVDHKDQATLLRAVGCMKDQALSGFRVFIVGEGELRLSLEALSAQLGISHLVRFTGFRRDVPAFLSAFDVFVMSSKEEGLGTAVLDAMAAGLPVVCTDGGGLPEMIENEKGGLLSPARNPEALAASMALLLRDAERRARFGAYNKTAVQRFSYQSTFRMTLAAYAKLFKDR
ncbi:MAG: glycosyltransferase [Spirochaetia bacterium]|nr:glycosyltransferase [Spirochaetia bacterium]